MWFWIEFLTANTSVVYVTGVVASFFAFGVTTFLTWKLKPHPATPTGCVSRPRRDDSGYCPEENEQVEDAGDGASDKESDADEDTPDERDTDVTTSPMDSDSVRKRVVMPVSKPEEMTDEEKREEKRVVQEQLKEIYKLMRSEEDKFGGVSLSEMQQQLRYYKT